MPDSAGTKPPQGSSPFVHQIAVKTARKLRVQRRGPRTVWFGLGMSGLIGWSVSIPTLAGGMLGLWWDSRHPGNRSWTLMLLMAGLVLGCFNAWHWVAQQNDAMDEPDDDEPGGKDE